MWRWYIAITILLLPVLARGQTAKTFEPSDHWCTYEEFKGKKTAAGLLHKEKKLKPSSKCQKYSPSLGLWDSSYVCTDLSFGSPTHSFVAICEKEISNSIWRIITFAGNIDECKGMSREKSR
jgi:hypothetical protein